MNSKESKKEAKYAMLSYETELGWYEKSGDKKTWLMLTLRNYSTHLSDETRNKYKAGNVEGLDGVCQQRRLGRGNLPI